MEVGQSTSSLGMIGLKIGQKSQQTQAQVVTDAMQSTKQLVQNPAQSAGNGGGHTVNIKA
jgi:hypothetical protein